MTAVISNRKIHRDELRARIYRSAIELFQARGYAAVSVDQIVSRAGVAKGTFFNFFPTKLAVLKAYYAEIDTEIALRRLAMDPSQPKAALLAYAADVESLLRREGTLMLELLETVSSDGEMRRMDAESGDSDSSSFSAFIELAKARGALLPHVDAHWAGVAIVDLWAGASRDWLRSPEQSLVDHFKPRIELLFLGCEVQP